jgi:hypothetical protein
MFLGFHFILGFSTTLFTAIAAAPIGATGTTTNATSPSVTSTTLLSNAQAAQQINDQSRSAQLSDSCTSKHLCLSPFLGHSNNNADGQSACIANAITQCHNEQWEITLRCPKTQKCFALPSLTSEGTVRTPSSPPTDRKLKIARLSPVQAKRPQDRYSTLSAPRVAHSDQTRHPTALQAETGLRTKRR